MLKYKHIIFDFDGTLSDSYPSFVKAMSIVMQKYGIEKHIRMVSEDYGKIAEVLIDKSRRNFPVPQQIPGAKVFSEPYHIRNGIFAHFK